MQIVRFLRVIIFFFLFYHNTIYYYLYIRVPTYVISIVIIAVVVGFFCDATRNANRSYITNEPIRPLICVGRSKYKSVTLSDARVDKRRFNAKPPQ